jgi:hypothetical protein
LTLSVTFEIRSRDGSSKNDRVGKIADLIRSDNAGNLVQPGLAISRETTYAAVIPIRSGGRRWRRVRRAGLRGDRRRLSSLLAMFENAEAVETRRVRVILAGGVKILTAGELVAGAVSPRVAWPLQHRALAHHQQIVERTRRRIPREKRYRYKPS